MEFVPFPKLSRLSRDIVITEKLDGTNAQLAIFPFSEEEASKNGALVSDNKEWIMRVGSRSRYLTPEQDNFGFFAWATSNKEALFGLGAGSHFGEWWGRGIQRGYGLEEKKFSLFNTARWKAVASDAEGREVLPACVGLVPVLYEGPFDTDSVDIILERLHDNGSVAAPGFMNPEGVVVYHTHSRTLFKKTLDNNDQHKWMEKNNAA